MPSRSARGRIKYIGGGFWGRTLKSLFFSKY
nr:MAG TPA: hypothetical protein [Caudoviricetes sp.]DAP13679.1 MAG TPA: hypothetical protein [Caudoviricetes sp.]